VLRGLGVAGLVVRGGSAAWAACAVTRSETAGPFWVDANLHRSDIRPDPSDGSTVPGVPLALAITLLRADAECAPAAGARIDVWHCSAAGRYSDEASNGTSGKHFLRGYQTTDANGAVRFTTIYPGWYPGRTVHVHVRVRTFEGATTTTNFTSQLYFDDATSEQVLAGNAAYDHGTRTTFNTNDVLYRAANQLALTSDGGGGYVGTVAIALNGLRV
jgi:protocatechuate 3,4-dioxygenase beta subunit